MVLILYASLVAPKLPPFMVELLRNNFVRIIILFLIVWTGSKDPSLALLISICFVISMNYITNLSFIRLSCIYR